jgi:hypothetical protein
VIGFFREFYGLYRQQQCSSSSHITVQQMEQIGMQATNCME